MSDTPKAGTSGLMSTKQSGCGLRPDEKAMEVLDQGEGIDFSAATTLLLDEDDSSSSHQDANSNSEKKLNTNKYID